jgi:riboflavin kinase/FMN adenylyltransferase
MQIYNSLDHFSVLPHPVVAMGNFDGVHLGHQKIIGEVVSRAKQNNGTSVVITFNINTKLFFGKIKESELIYTEEEKTQALEKLGVDVCVVLDFASIKDMTALNFVRDILVQKIGIKEFIIGYDTNFGSDRKGDKAHLIALGDIYNFTVTEVEPLKKDGEIVSSTELRKR